jgi:hypothetical protein
MPQPKSTESKTQERTIRHLFFAYTDVQQDAIGNDVIVPMTAYQGDTVKLRPSDIERGEKFGAFVGTTPDDDAPRGMSLAGNSNEEQAAALGLLENGETPSDQAVEAIAAKPMQQALRLVGDDPDLARRVAEAEENKPEEERRPALIARLDAIHNSA